MISVRLILSLCVCLVAGEALGQNTVPRFEIGPHFTYTAVNVGVPQVDQYGSLGGRLVVNATRLFSFESEVSYSPFTPRIGGAFDGGKMTQALFGAKAGVRRTRLGVFGKIRPGVVSFDNVVLRENSGNGFTTGRATQKALDFGGVLEMYVSRRISIRYDVGDLIVFYPESELGGPGASPARTLHNFQFGSGVLFRF